MTTFVQNRKVHFNYDIERSLEAGIELFGHEVKSIKSGHGTLDGAYVIIRGGEAYLIGVTIPPYQVKNAPKDYDPARTRKLLLHKKELKQLGDIEAGKGLTIVPISLYNNKGNIKVELGIAKGKKRFDKRESIKKRESDIDIRRSLKR